MSELPWPDDWVWGDASPAPTAATTPTLVMFFNLECPACVARGVPFLKRLQREYGAALNGVLVHTALGHRQLERDDVVPTLRRFAGDFAKLSQPVALDLTGELADSWGVEGTPHWFVFDAAGQLVRSLYGSQENAQTRLEYSLEELLVPDSAPNGAAPGEAVE